MKISPVLSESLTNVVQILNLGAIGLGFLLAAMAYQLLRVEQRVATPRPSVLKATYVYMGFALTLTIVGFISEYLRQSTTDAVSSRDATIAHLRTETTAKAEELQKLQERLTTVDHSLSELRERVIGVHGSLTVAQAGRGAAIEGLSEDAANNPAIRQVRAQLMGIHSSLQEMIDRLNLDKPVGAKQ